MCGKKPGAHRTQCQDQHQILRDQTDGHSVQHRQPAREGDLVLLARQSRPPSCGELAMLVFGARQMICEKPQPEDHERAKREPKDRPMPAEHEAGEDQGRRIEYRISQARKRWRLRESHGTRAAPSPPARRNRCTSSSAGRRCRPRLRCRARICRTPMQSIVAAAVFAPRSPPADPKPLPSISICRRRVHSRMPSAARQRAVDRRRPSGWNYLSSDGRRRGGLCRSTESI